MVTPFAIVLIAPEFFEDAVDHVVWAALDEPGIIFEQLVDWFFEFHFASGYSWCFLNDRHGFAPFLACLSSELSVTVEKSPARFVVPGGGSDPTKLLGGLAPKKLGRSRPLLAFFHGDLWLPRFRIYPVPKDLEPLWVKSRQCQRCRA